MLDPTQAASSAMPSPLLLSLLVTLGASACTSYRVEPLSPALGGKKVRVSVRDTVGHRRYVSVDVKDFWYRDDALGGRLCRHEDPRQPWCTWEDWSVRRELVVGLRVKRYDGKKTGHAALAGLFATGAVLGAAAGGAYDEWGLFDEMSDGAALQLGSMCNHYPNCVGQQPAFFEVFWVPLPGALCPVLLPVGEKARLPT